MTERIYRPGDTTNPLHYRREGQQECIDAMREDFVRRFGERGEDMFVGFCLGNAFKYRWRAGHKEGTSAESDTAKAEWYEQMANHLRYPEMFPDPREGIKGVVEPVDEGR